MSEANYCDRGPWRRALIRVPQVPPGLRAGERRPNREADVDVSYPSILASPCCVTARSQRHRVRPDSRESCEGNERSPGSMLPRHNGHCLILGAGD
jgi:hypothetical protein